MIRDINLQTLAAALDGLAARQRATANNIANSDTPGYKSQYVSFEGALQRAINHDPSPPLAMEATDRAHLVMTPPTEQVGITVRERPGAVRNDGNNVDVDLEMSMLAETAVRYQAMIQLAGSRVGLIKNIIRERA